MSDASWVDALAVDDLPNNDVLGVDVAGRDIAIYTVDDTTYATDNRCTHGDAQLCVGFLEGFEIECPLHQGKFDIRTGQATCEPATEPLRTYPIRIDGGRVFVKLD